MLFFTRNGVLFKCNAPDSTLCGRMLHLPYSNRLMFRYRRWCVHRTSKECYLSACSDSVSRCVSCWVSGEWDGVLTAGSCVHSLLLTARSGVYYRYRCGTCHLVSNFVLKNLSSKISYYWYQGSLDVWTSSWTHDVILHRNWWCQHGNLNLPNEQFRLWRMWVNKILYQKQNQEQFNQYRHCAVFFNVPITQSTWQIRKHSLNFWI